MGHLDLTEWKREGRGTIASLAEGGVEVRVETPLTLWCPQRLTGAFRFRFACHLTTPNSAMLAMLCARAWRGPDLLAAERGGAYDEYSCQDLEMYTVGFNRTGNVSNQIQPNASMANIRRIGGPGHTRYTSGAMRLGTDSTNWDLWNEWNTRSLLASAREFVAGTHGHIEYELRSDPPRLSLIENSEEVLTVVDHQPPPLVGGYVALRCMTPGACFRIRGDAVFL